MRVPEHPTQIQRMLTARLKKLGLTAPPLAASFGSYGHRCGRPTCRCQKGGPLHRTQQLTYKVEGKTRSVYVPKDLIPQVQAWLAQHQQLKTLLHEIQLLTLASIRTHVRHQRRQRGRS